MKSCFTLFRMIGFFRPVKMEEEPSFYQLLEGKCPKESISV